MKIKESMYKKVAVLDLRGKLMGPPATTSLVDDVQDLLKNGVTRIVLDLKHVNWINSLGLGSIVKVLSVVRKNSGALYLAGLSAKERSLMVMSQLTKIVTIHDTAEEAVEELNKK